MGGALKLAKGLASETPGYSWEELGESSRSLQRVVLGALRGTPAKIKESQVERKKNKEMRELEREDYLLVIYGVVVNGYL